MTSTAVIVRLSLPETTCWNPDLDCVDLGTGLGIASRRVDTAEQLPRALDQTIADPGPHLIEVVIPPYQALQQLPAIRRGVEAK